MRIAMVITYPVTLLGNRWAIVMTFNKALEVNPKPITKVSLILIP